MINNLMNKNYYPTNPEEKRLYTKIDSMNKSEEIQLFIKNLKNILEEKVELFAYRIKQPFSAIRTYRLAGYNHADQLHDLLGFLLVVDNASEIEKIKNLIIDSLKEEKFKSYNLLVEKKFSTNTYTELDKNIRENQYNQLIFDDINKWLEIPVGLDKLLPPFSYNILCEKDFKDTSTISIEIRIQTKEDFITTESYYYTIHKNDSIKLNLKIPLLCMCFRILRRKSNIAFEKDDRKKEKYQFEINQILNKNINFVKENKDILDTIFQENSKLIDCWKKGYPIYEFKRLKVDK